MIFASFFLAACAPDAAACGSKSFGIVINGAWVRPTTGTASDIGSTSAYLEINNCGNAADALLKVDTPAAGLVELHKSETREGMTMMSGVSRVELPAGKKVIFKPGDLHIMMMKMNQELTAGQSIRLVLTFEKNGQITIDVPVKDAGN